MADISELQAKLNKLNDAFSRQIPERMQQLNQAWAMIKSEEHYDQQKFEDFHRMAHSLTGAGKTFGFEQISDDARALEIVLRECAARAQPLTAADREQIETCLSVLQQTADQVSSND